jgi:hypothetical protein
MRYIRTSPTTVVDPWPFGVGITYEGFGFA